MTRSPRIERLVADARRPFRLWMTGSLAVVMAALCTGRGVADQSRLAQSMRLLRISPFSVAETVARIEEAAWQRGQSVIARVDDTRPVLVLGSSLGGTPVVMADEQAPPAVPLSVQVKPAGRGASEVLVPRAAGDDWQLLLPAPVAAEIAALPEWLDHALR